MDSFLAYTGCEAMMKITVMVYPRELNLTFEELSQVIKKEFQKGKLVIVERTKFLSKIQEQNETNLQ